MKKEEYTSFLNTLQENDSLDSLFNAMTEPPFRAEFQKWLLDHLLTQNEAIEYTDQSIYGIRQSLALKALQPFYEKGKGPGKITLILKEDAIEYGVNKPIQAESKKRKKKDE